MPFAQLMYGEVIERVVLRAERPEWPAGTPFAYRQLAEECWQTNPMRRPLFPSVVMRLEEMMGVCREGLDTMICSGFNTCASSRSLLPMTTPNMTELSSSFAARTGLGLDEGRVVSVTLPSRTGELLSGSVLPTASGTPYSTHLSRSHLSLANAEGPTAGYWE